MKVVPLAESYGSVEILNSKFQAYLFPFSGEGCFAELYQKAKSLSPKADHYPYSYIFGEVIKSFDDGEPGAAAGRPILSLLQSRGIDRAMVVVARYFGGSKLGLPRLRKAFLSAAENAIGNGKYGEVVELTKAELDLSYHDFEEARKFLSRRHGKLEVSDFGEKVRAILLSDDKIIDDLSETLSKESSLTKIGLVETIKELD